VSVVAMVVVICIHDEVVGCHPKSVSGMRGGDHRKGYGDAGIGAVVGNADEATT
jgi:hypothetical protein